jgi:hypothetical protein
MMAADNDDNEVNGNGATSNDDDYVNYYIYSQMNYIANLFTV